MSNRLLLQFQLIIHKHLIFVVHLNTHIFFRDVPLIRTPSGLSKRYLNIYNNKTNKKSKNHNNDNCNHCYCNNNNNNYNNNNKTNYNTTTNSNNIIIMLVWIAKPGYIYICQSGLKVYDLNSELILLSIDLNAELYFIRYIIQVSVALSLFMTLTVRSVFTT